MNPSSAEVAQIDTHTGGMLKTDAPRTSAQEREKIFSIHRSTPCPIDLRLCGVEPEPASYIRSCRSQVPTYRILEHRRSEETELVPVQYRIQYLDCGSPVQLDPYYLSSVCIVYVVCMIPFDPPTLGTSEPRTLLSSVTCLLLSCRTINLCLSLFVTRIHRIVATVLIHLFFHRHRFAYTTTTSCRIPSPDSHRL